MEAFSLHDIIYRRAQESEIQLAYKLLKIAALRLQKVGIDQWGYWLDPPEYKQKWLQSGFASGEYYFLHHNTNLIGMYRMSDSDEDYWGTQQVEARYIHSLVIIPEYSGHHIGQAIVERVKSQMQNQRIPLLRLDCHAGNKKLCAYYERMGFVKVGEKLMPHSLNNLYELTV